jgi:hypothetical protein
VGISKYRQCMARLEAMGQNYVDKKIADGIKLSAAV